MAKKKRKTRASKKKQTQALFSSFKQVKQMLIWACVLLLCLFALLYLYQYFSPLQALGKADKVPTTGYRLLLPAYGELPELNNGQTEQVVAHEGYTVSYNPTYKVANWVAYELTRQEALSKKARRSDKFLPDPDIKGGTPLTSTYARSGYDRGHMAPAADMRWSEKAMRESFYTGNICPQVPKLNRGIWKQLEELTREWAVADSALLIATGPIIRAQLKQMGTSGVAVPDSFYKVIVSPYGKHPKGIGFLFANRDYKKTPVKAQAVSIDRIEEVTGIDFFASLPDEMERETEPAFELEDWCF